MSTPLEIDGSFGEGGGQILRSSLTLSLLTGRAFRLSNIRAGRPKPGLQPQHLQSVRAAGQIGQAEMRGASLQSSRLDFEPGSVKPGNYRFDIGTAGAIGLVLHTIYLPLALRSESASKITLVGGTHVRTAPCFHFLDVTWRAYLSACGLEVALDLQRPGFYPRGGGVVEATIRPCSQLTGLSLLTRPKHPNAVGFSAVAGLPGHIAKRQARRARTRLEQAGTPIDFDEQTWEGGPGSVIAVTLETKPAPTLFFSIGERGKSAEKVADETVADVRAYLDADGAIDEHSADQLILPLAFAKGSSKFSVTRLTRHLTTNIAVVRMFLDREIVCEGKEGQPGKVRIV